MTKWKNSSEIEREDKVTTAAIESKFTFRYRVSLTEWNQFPWHFSGTWLKVMRSLNDFHHEALMHLYKAVMLEK